MDVKTLGIVGLAVAAPTLVRSAVRAGVPIPAYVTDAQRAALAQLDAHGLGGNEQATHRYGDYNARMLAQRGPAPGKSHKANLSPSDLDALCAAFLGAAHAGVMHDGAHPYLVADSQVALAPGLVEALWQKLDQADGRDLTSLGVAVARVMRVRDGIASGFLESPEDMLGGNLAVGQLAIEMDDQGYLIGGAPDEKTLKGGLGAAWDATLEFAQDASVEGAKLAAKALWHSVKTSPILLLGGAYLAWRVVR